MSEAVPHAVMLPWRGQRHPFAFAIDQWRVLQRQTSAGPWVLEARCVHRLATADEVAAILTCGLVGGGMALAEAEALVGLNMGPAPGRLTEALVVAKAALVWSLHDVESDIVGERKGTAKTAKRRSPTVK